LKPLWEGAISFGLILIPVRLYKATDEQKPGFHLVREKDLCPITYTRVCKYTGEEVPYSEIARGYQYQQGTQVILHDEDFRQAKDLNIHAAEPLSQKEIDIAIMLIEQLSSPFKPSDYSDTYKQEIERMIDEKIKTGKVSSIEKAQHQRQAEVIDLLEKLKSSLEEAKKKNAS